MNRIDLTFNCRNWIWSGWRNS